MTLEMNWMRADAPYMPVATAGLLSALADAGTPATAVWKEAAHGRILSIETDQDAGQIADAIIEAPWPDISRVPWGTKVGQAIKPMLEEAENPVVELHRLRRAMSGNQYRAERRLLNAYVTEAALDDNALPGRNRLLRGVKADLSGIAEKVKLDRDQLSAELAGGLDWRTGKSGRGLGFMPEIQTFGGTTGRTPADIGSHSVLMYRLLWLGILALPPVGVVRRGRRVVGGPLVTDTDRISWPVWSVPLDLHALRLMFCLAEIHAEAPEAASLASRGVVAVYRARSIPINSMISVFRWGERIR